MTGDNHNSVFVYVDFGVDPAKTRPHRSVSVSNRTYTRLEFFWDFRAFNLALSLCLVFVIKRIFFVTDALANERYALISSSSSSVLRIENEVCLTGKWLRDRFDRGIRATCVDRKCERWLLDGSDGRRWHLRATTKLPVRTHANRKCLIISDTVRIWKWKANRVLSEAANKKTHPSAAHANQWKKWARSF